MDSEEMDLAEYSNWEWVKHYWIEGTIGTMGLDSGISVTITDGSDG